MSDQENNSTQRNSFEEIKTENELLKSNPIIQDIIDGFSAIVVILNKNKQVVAYNRNAIILFDDSSDNILGKRLGEALNCIHAWEMEDGCGTSQFCKQCGANIAFEKSIGTLHSQVEECRIKRDPGGNLSSLDLRVFTKILRVNGNEYLFCSIEDIANEKRREVLERVFFHDVLNTCSAINGLAGVLTDADDNEERSLILSSLQKASDQLSKEIHSQIVLKDAEDQNLKPRISEVTVKKILDDVKNLYSKSPLAKNKNLDFTYPGQELIIKTDFALLERALSNLVKNALEASKEGNEVKVHITAKDKEIVFNVWNNGYMPKNVQLQIFNRSFSTKGEKGHGLGTYGAKLLIEQYLGGKVEFVSTKEEKTTFSISLPR